MKFLKCLFQSEVLTEEEREDSGLKKRGSRSLSKTRRGRFLLGFFGLLLLSLSLVIHLLDPLELFIAAATTPSVGNLAFRLWEEPPIPALMRVHVFNYTNTEAFIRGEEPLRVQDIGPYVFSIKFQNINATFNQNNTLTFIPRRLMFENEELTVGDPKNDVIYSLNVPFLGVGSFLSNGSIFTKMAFSSVTAMMGMEPFLKLTSDEFLWGYEDALIKHANKFLPNIVNFEKLGYLDQFFGEPDNIVTLNMNSVPVVRDGRVIQPRSIDRYNGKTGLSYFGYDEDDVNTHRTCNTLSGVASDGVLFPRPITPDMNFQVYRKLFCKFLPIHYDSAGPNKHGIPVYWYKLAKYAFMNSHPENSCLCDPRVKPCLPDGLSDIGACFWDMPVASSLPHLLDVNMAEVKTVEGMTPTEEKHRSLASFQQDLGLLLQANTRLQVNLFMGDMGFAPRLRPFSNMVLPVLWVDYCFEELPPMYVFVIYTLVVVLPVVQYCCMILFGVVGVFLLAAFLVRMFHDTDDNHRRRRQREEEEQKFIARCEKIQITPVVMKENLTVL